MTASPISEQQLVDDVRHYESFGVHRYGSPGAEAALHWISDELAKAGLTVSHQRFSMDRQYDFQSGSLSVGGHRLRVMPHWWPPDQASFSFSATLAPGGLEYLTLPFDRSAYLNDDHRARLSEAFARKPQAVLLSIDHPSGEIFTYNVDQTGTPWPVPVILVAPKDRPVLDAASRSGSKVDVNIVGSYRRGVEGRNVVARSDRGRGKWLVFSTPVTSWFTSTVERGPGIALFLAFARQATQRLTNMDLVFVATSGHEIGHGGMEHFLRKEAPLPSATLAWAHFGASIACRNAVERRINSSEALRTIVDRHFANVEGTHLYGDRAAIGELREVHASGYAGFFGMAGQHEFFHTSADSLSSLSTDMLAPIALAFLATLEEVAANTD